jgi:hypothetical protein
MQSVAFRIAELLADFEQSGLSIYWKGPNFQNLNEGQPGGYCANVLDGIDSDSAYDSCRPAALTWSFRWTADDSVLLDLLPGERKSFG